MSFEEVHGKGSLEEARTMATFHGVKPEASNDDGKSITFTWPEIGEWIFEYTPPTLVFKTLVMWKQGQGFLSFAASKAQEVTERFFDGDMIITAEDPRGWLATYLAGMGFSRDENMEAERNSGQVRCFVADHQKVTEWGEWVENGAKPEDEPAWRQSLRLAGLIPDEMPEPPMM
jgi:hypothetical protein